MNSQFVRRVKIIVPILSLAVIAAFSLAGWSFYSAHQQSCQSRNQTLDVLRDVILIASAPGRPRTSEEIKRTDMFQRAAFARINLARC